MKQIPLFSHLFQDPNEKLTVVKRSKSVRIGTTYDTMTRAEIKLHYPKWNGEYHILRADYRLGLSVTIKELRPNLSK